MQSNKRENAAFLQLTRFSAIHAILTIVIYCIFSSAVAEEKVDSDEAGTFADSFESVDAFVEQLTRPSLNNRNIAQREDWLRDNGFGIFVTWAPDSQLGFVISHSLVGASEDYIDRYINRLPQTFNPTKFDPNGLARLIKLVGARYALITTKHHSGFALWDSETTAFDAMSTPFGQDIVEMFTTAIRDQGIGVGLYYSPEDFAWLYNKGVRDFDRLTAPSDYAPFRAEFEGFVEDQISELFGSYGPIDMFFNDGEIFGTTNDVVWDISPETLITRTALPSPEQTVPSIGYDRAWESIITMTDQWNFKANDVDRKSPMKIVETLIETRAKGGALLINVGLRPDGQVDDYEYKMLTTLAGWNFINEESLFDVRPWVITHEDKVWFTRSKDSSTVYAFLTGQEDWAIGERRDVIIKSVDTTSQTRMSILGASGEVVEYEPDLRGKGHPVFREDDDGVHVSVMRTQRFYNDYGWPFPIVLKMENVKPALRPCLALTADPVLEEGTLTMKGNLIDLGDGQKAQVGFEYRAYGGFIGDYEGRAKSVEWKRTNLQFRSRPGEFNSEIAIPESDGEIILRAVAVHPTGVVIYGNSVIIGESGEVSRP